MDFPPIYGFNECSEMGNDIFAPSVFIGGCNMRCPYCMNSKLINPQDVPQVDDRVIHDYIRKNNSEWVMISGGEPTCLHPKLLLNLINYFKGLGCKIGMSTNGIRIEELKDIIPYLNYVALDLKAPEGEIYKDITKDCKETDPYINLMRASFLLVGTKANRDDFDYEKRTTLYPAYIDEKAIRNIGEFVFHDDKWVLQQFRHANNMLSEEAYDVEPYSEAQIRELLKIAQKFTSKAELRYV